MAKRGLNNIRGLIRPIETGRPPSHDPLPAPAVVVFGRAALKDVKNDAGSDFVIQQVIDEYNADRTRGHYWRHKRAYVPSELKLPSNNDVEEATRFLAAPLLRHFGLQAALVDTRLASRTARSTEGALDKVEKLVGINHIGGLFVAYGVETNPDGSIVPHLPDSESRVETLRQALRSFDLPTVEIELVPATQQTLDAEEAPELIQRLYLEEGIYLPPYNQ